jgi:hypothetical protein
MTDEGFNNGIAGGFCLGRMFAFGRFVWYSERKSAKVLP